MNTEQINHIIKQTCKDNNATGLYPEITFTFSKRLTKTFARAHCHLSIIEISEPLWHRADIQEKKEMFIHETCHIIAYNKFGGHITHHGKEWRECMGRAGILKQEYRHNINTEGLRRQPIRYEAQCSCRIFDISHVRAGRFKSRVYNCDYCKQPVHLTGNRIRKEI
jgi:predicted SprT family Zn-dependent metalloprotease